MDVHRPCLDEPVVAPHAFQQPFPREHAAAVLDQALEQFEFPARQADAGAVDGDRDRLEVGDDLPPTVDGSGAVTESMLPSRALLLFSTRGSVYSEYVSGH